MIRGTTPTHSFTIPFSESEIKDLKIIYGQNDKPLFEKLKADCIINGQTVATTLTAEETYKFDCKKLGQAQIYIEFISGEKVNSEIILFAVGKCLKEV